MFKRISSFLFKDMGLKLMAIAFAVVLWLAANTMTDPLQNEEFTVTLTPENADVLIRDDIRVLNLDALSGTQITVGIRAPASDIARLKDDVENGIGSAVRNAIKASIDLRNVIVDDVRQSGEPVTIDATVNTDISIDGAQRVNLSPKVVTVQLDNYVTQSFDIQVREAGEVADGYELIDTSSAQSTVAVSAAKSVLDTVYEVRANVDVMDAEGNVDAVSKLVAYDSSWNDITDDLVLDIAETGVHATVLPYKEVRLAMAEETLGEPALNHIVTGMTVTPERVFVVGLPEVLEEIDALYLPQPDLTEQSESFDTVTDLRQSLPSNVKLREGEVTEATVAVEIEPLESREYAYPIDMIRVTGIFNTRELNAQIVDMETVPIMVRGSTTAMGTMNVSLISATLDLSGLDVGEHSIDLRVSVPSTITLMNAPTVNVRISEAVLPEEPEDGEGEGTNPDDLPLDFVNPGGDTQDEGILRIDAVTGEVVSGEEEGLPAEEEVATEEEASVPGEESPDEFLVAEPAAEEPAQ